MHDSDRSDNEPRERDAVPVPDRPSGPSPEVPDPDQDILDRIHVGDLDLVIRMMMDRYGEAVFRFCCSRLRNDAAAEDVNQNIFIQAHRDLCSFAGRSTLRAWLFAIARHRVLDALKGNKISANSDPIDEWHSLSIADQRPDASERIDDIRLVNALRECLETLPEPILSSVLLRYQQGLSFEEMAQMNGDKPGTLRARVARALPRLRRCIEYKTGGTV
jgi:RNA polymerase sigma-70 factor, ECF subfamily